MRQTNIYAGISWLVTLIIPVVLVLSGVRVLMTPLFLQLEYNLPGFPQDAYGFNKEERLYWSGVALDYLLNEDGISFLADLRFQDGAEVYNPRELRHMEDVKVVVQTMLLVWYLSLVLLTFFGIWAWIGKWGNVFIKGVWRGGWLTLILLGAAILFITISFGIFFVAFHNLFFEAGTWTFLYSDTLIRLFPERFWRDAFLFVCLIAGGAGLIIVLMQKHFRQREFLRN